jgi:hypothetical protein
MRILARTAFATCMHCVGQIGYWANRAPNLSQPNSSYIDQILNELRSLRAEVEARGSSQPYLG